MSFFGENMPFGSRVWNSIKYPVAFVALLWIIQGINHLVGQSLNVFGIYPREIHGLIGILTSNFLHGNWQHLMGNTPILLLLASCVCLYSPRQFFITSIIGSLIGATITWFFGSPAYHVGASLLIFVLWGAILGYAIFQRKPFFIILSVILLPIYGVSFLYGLIPTPQVSFIGHLGGFIGGLIVARYYSILPKKKNNSIINYNN
jgi:membrane associated rhomboid family serine protease